MDKDFLLTTDSAKHLFHTYAENLPVIDYHCHIDPAQILENHEFSDITEAWLGADHYKWRLMRVCGADEKYVTGDASAREKFREFCRLLPLAPGHPVYHWCHLELRRYFGCELIIGEKTADEIFDICGEKLKSLRVRDIIKESNVKAICTTDDPADELSSHTALKADTSFGTVVLPAFRPDKSINLHKGDYPEYLQKLGLAANIRIATLDDLLAALENRIDYFDAHGCRASDHGLDCVNGEIPTQKEASAIFAKALSGGISQSEQDAFASFMLCFLGREYAKRGWAMEIHVGAERNVNAKMFSRLGPDTGFDAVRDGHSLKTLHKVLDQLDRESLLPKTLVFSLNHNDNLTITTLTSCFSQGGVPGKVQPGAAWWFNDSILGMREHMERMASVQALGNFVGMLTDSRSFLSYPRHEYFRRILCGYLGDLVEGGLYPEDYETLGRIVQNISYYNAAKFIGFDLK
jgi:glucuronate isomerase